MWVVCTRAGFSAYVSTCDSPSVTPINHIVLHGVMWTNMPGGVYVKCLIKGGQMWDMCECNAGGSSMLHEPPAQHLRHSQARRPWILLHPHWPGAAKDLTGPPSCQSAGEAVWDVASDDLSLAQRRYQQRSSQIDTSAAVTQSGCRAARGHNKVDQCLQVQSEKGENSEWVKKRRPSIITKSRHAKPLMTYRVIS